MDESVCNSEIGQALLVFIHLYYEKLT